ncbi:MAG: hypothetical protein HETSPECPRED_005749 [Heterodermia speciosa]|uniref:C2H2-type domain-containing protein n=1 Tax=Heterodermia speciosa TaxID=116794 RepID=A0A8H3IEI3_9LECA|nr:MAG: hypothetical protein HETSPECPRED_005749 [Heterodermia speciosa]
MPTRDLAVIDLTESSPPRSRSAVLVDAITTAPDERVRAALRLGCELSKEVEQMVQNMLLVPVDRVSSKIVEKDADSDGYVKEVGSDEEEEDDDKSSEDESDVGHQDVVSAPSLKRFRPRFATCENCKEEFDVETNDGVSCIWHPEGKEADYDADIWVDHDEDCHGRIDGFDDDPNYAEGFRYECCGRSGDNEGCKLGTHVEEENVYKKMRR